jgi:hypothetical protein
MNPSTVRTRILQDHGVLRKHLRKLELEVDAMHANPARRPEIADLARGLLSQLIAHTQAEDDILAPALRDIDAWGSIRATMLLDQHQDQRMQLRRLIDVYGGAGDSKWLAQLTLEWIYDVRADMAHEETSVLSAALLKDDFIDVSMESG